MEIRYLHFLIFLHSCILVLKCDNFCAPASNVILHTLHEMSFEHTMGTLVIIPCDTGSTLNFGLALERALNDALRIKMITVNDVKDEDQSKLLTVSLGGIIIIYKIAGAMSNENKSLFDIYKFCKDACLNLVSTQIELPANDSSGDDQSCSCLNETFSTPKYVPEAPPVTTINIHLEDIVNIPDVSITSNFRVDSEIMYQSNKLGLKPGDSIAILLNNNLALSKLEAYFCARNVMEYFFAKNVNVSRFYVNDFARFSSFNLTISILRVTNHEILTYLDAPCSAPGWQNVNQVGPLTTQNCIGGLVKRTTRTETPIKGPQLTERQTNILLFSLQFACNALISCERQLNNIIPLTDTETNTSYRLPGSTGTKMKNLAETVLKRMKQEKVELKYPFTFFDNMSKILEKTVGGSSGCIYSIIFEAAACVFLKCGVNALVTADLWLDCFEAAAKALKRYGNTDFGDGTMYDPIHVFCVTSREEFNKGSDPLIAFGNGVERAEETIETFRKQKSFTDPGAHAVGIWMRAIYEAVKIRWPA